MSRCSRAKGGDVHDHGVFPLSGGIPSPKRSHPVRRRIIYRCNEVGEQLKDRSVRWYHCGAMSCDRGVAGGGTYVPGRKYGQTSSGGTVRPEGMVHMVFFAGFSAVIWDGEWTYSTTRFASATPGKRSLVNRASWTTVSYSCAVTGLACTAAPARELSSTAAAARSLAWRLRSSSPSRRVHTVFQASRSAAGVSTGERRCRRASLWEYQRRTVRHGGRLTLPVRRFGSEERRGRISGRLGRRDCAGPARMRGGW